MTKTYRFKKNICLFFSLLCSIGPLLVFIGMALVQSEGKEKLVLSMTLIAAIMIALISFMRKIHLRSTIYIIILGLYFCLDNLIPFILCIAICTLLDEILFTPLYKRFKEDYHTHKQIDKRFGKASQKPNMDSKQANN